MFLMLTATKADAPLSKPMSTVKAMKAMKAAKKDARQEANAMNTANGAKQDDGEWITMSTERARSLDQVENDVSICWEIFNLQK